MNGDEGSLWVGLLADSGAYESAALALLPAMPSMAGSAWLRKPTRPM
jgi:hypothetical protein